MTYVRSVVVGSLAVIFGVAHHPWPSSPEAAVEQVATLDVARSAHTATVLASGRILIAGGMASGGGSLGSVELYDPEGNSVRAIAKMAERRAGHTATLLDDGRVLIAGGYNGEYLRSAELFDPETQRFRPAGPLSQGRSEHTATRLTDGRVLLVGGVGRGWSFLASAEVYDPATERFEPVGAMAVARESHTATMLADGRVLVVGGHRGRREAMEVYSSSEVYDPRSQAFTSAASLAIARHKHDAVSLADGRVLVIAGADRTDRRYFETTEIYNPGADAFTAGPSMSSTRYKINGTSVRLPDRSVLVAGGSRTVERLDPQGMVFHNVAGGITAAYAFATATLLPDGDVLIIGGYDEQNRNTAGVWRFHHNRAARAPRAGS